MDSFLTKINEHCDVTIDEDKYTLFFRKNYPSLVFYAARFLDREEAEDVVQDAFTDLWQRREAIDAGGRLLSFMYRSVYTKALNKLKHTAVTNNYGFHQMEVFRKKMDYFSPDNNDVMKTIVAQDIGQKMEEVIGQLPDKCREVFVLSYIHGLRNKAIAEALAISVKTVEAHMNKALRVLREKLSYLFGSVLSMVLVFSGLMK